MPDRVIVTEWTNLVYKLKVLEMPLLLFHYCLFMIIWNAALILISEENVHNALISPFCLCNNPIDVSTSAKLGGI